MFIFQHLLFFLFVTKLLNIVRHIYDVLLTCSTALKDLQVSFTGHIESYLLIDSYAVKYNITTKHPQINRSMHFLKDYIELRQQISDNWTVNWVCHINWRIMVHIFNINFPFLNHLRPVCSLSTLYQQNHLESCVLLVKEIVINCYNSILETKNLLAAFHMAPYSDHSLFAVFVLTHQ